jgi:hypothetical protein
MVAAYVEAMMVMALDTRLRGVNVGVCEFQPKVSAKTSGTPIIYRQTHRFPHCLYHQTSASLIYNWTPTLTPRRQ